MYGWYGVLTMKKSWDFTARDRDEYWQQLVPHDGSASSTRAAKMLVVLLNESSIKKIGRASCRERV